jgi:hypothetical protein
MENKSRTETETNPPSLLRYSKLPPPEPRMMGYEHRLVSYFDDGLLF